MGDDEYKNYDDQGNFIPRKWFADEKYTDFYGPTIQDKNGDQAGKFFINEYKKLGSVHLIGELVVIALFAAFIAYGVYNVYYIAMTLKDLYIQYATENELAVQLVKDYASDKATSYSNQYGIYALIFVGIILAVYLISLAISFLVVRVFSYVVTYIMYGSVILEIGLCAYIFYSVQWEYSWIFLIPLGINVLLLTVWHRKLKKAIKAIKHGSLAVAEQGWQLLMPQIVQSMFIGAICFFFTAVSISQFYNLTPFESVFIGTYEITKAWIYFGYACLFVFCAYIIYYVSQGMKILMIHHWYRGGGRMGFWPSYGVVRHRWWGLLGYAFLSTVIHMLQYVKKAMKGEFAPKDIAQAFSMTGELLPGREHAFSKKEGTPWYERLWMGLNTFTLPAIVIEDKLFHSALIRSVYLMLKDLAQMYIKETHIKKVLFLLQFSLTWVNTMVGAIAGYALARYMEFDPTLSYIFAGVGAGLFFFIGGLTTTLVLDDVNLAYVTVLYILSIDEVHKKEGYTIDKINNIDGQIELVVNKAKREKLSKKQKSKKKEKMKDSKKDDNKE